MAEKQLERMWFEKCWRRINVDMHIPDWDPVFFAKLDPVRYVELMEAGGAKSIVIFANSHVGLCNYPQRDGPEDASRQDAIVYVVLIRLTGNLLLNRHQKYAAGMIVRVSSLI